MTLRSLFALALIAASLLVGALPSWAHTEFVSSNPPNGAVLVQPNR